MTSRDPRYTIDRGSSSRNPASYAAGVPERQSDRQATRLVRELYEDDSGSNTSAGHSSHSQRRATQQTRAEAARASQERERREYEDTSNSLLGKAVLREPLAPNPLVQRVVLVPRKTDDSIAFDQGWSKDQEWHWENFTPLRNPIPVKRPGHEYLHSCVFTHEGYEYLRWGLGSEVHGSDNRLPSDFKTNVAAYTGYGDDSWAITGVSRSLDEMERVTKEEKEIMNREQQDGWKRLEDRWENLDEGERAGRRTRQWTSTKNKKVHHGLKVHLAIFYVEGRSRQRQNTSYGGASEYKARQATGYESASGTGGETDYYSARG